MVPEHSLQEPSYYDETEKLWMWKFEGNDMYMDLGEPSWTIIFFLHDISNIWVVLLCR